MNLPSGTRLGRYVVRARIGEGGLADVYRAFDAGSGREVALKVLGFERRAENPGLLDRMLREASILQALSHVPAVVRFVEMFEDPATRSNVLALEFVDGRTLGTLLGDPTLDVRQVIEWMGHACHALNDIHAAGWVHRDIKPENLILVDDPQQPLRLIDFNSSGSTAVASGKLTRAQGVFPHTPAYLAPECFDGVTPDTSADVYALAMTFAELLIGRHPLLPSGTNDLDTTTAWQQAHDDVPFPNLSAIRGDIPPALNRVLTRATAKARKDRIPDAVELWTELKAVWDGLDSGSDDSVLPEPTAVTAVVPPRTPIRSPTPSSGGGARTVVAVVVVVVLLLTVVAGLGTGWAVWQEQTRQAADRIAREMEAADLARRVEEERLADERREREAAAEVERLRLEAEAKALAEQQAVEQARERARARAAAIGKGVEAVEAVVEDPVTLDKLKNSTRIGSHFLLDDNASSMGSAKVEEVAGVLFFEGRQRPRTGATMDVTGVLTLADARGFTLQGRFDVDVPGERRCGWDGSLRFNQAGHPWSFRMQASCPDGHHYIDLFVDDAWLDAHPDHKPPEW